MLRLRFENGTSYEQVVRDAHEHGGFAWERVPWPPKLGALVSPRILAWLAKCAERVRRLSPLQLLTLYAFSSTAFGLVQGFLESGDVDISLPDPVDGCAVREMSATENKSSKDEGRELDCLESERTHRVSRIARLVQFAGPMLDENAKKGGRSTDLPGGALIEAAVENYLGLSWKSNPREKRAAESAMQESLLSCLTKRTRKNLAFLENLSAFAVASNEAVLFFPHARLVLHATRGENLETLDDYLRAAPCMTNDEWRAVLAHFVATLDAIFARMPPVPEPLVVYRGSKFEKECETQKGNGSFERRRYTSTTLDPVIAADFGGLPSTASAGSKKHRRRGNKGCVLELVVPKDARVLPMLSVTRYEAEMEVLLPRNEKFQFNAAGR